MEETETWKKMRFGKLKYGKLMILKSHFYQ